MDPAHTHLILNHIPVVGLGAAILLLLYAFVRKNDEMKKAALIGFVFLALSAIPVYLTGGEAEERVEHLPGVSEAFIEEHEEAATSSLIAIEILGALSLAGLVMTRRSKAVPKWLAVISLVASVVVAAVMIRTANLGGQIRHTEIRSGYSEPSQQVGGAEDNHQDDEKREREEREKRNDR
ncbi:MAG TPA: hypothetical protein VLG74_15810 [Blastocatellia bacterium]|nr:hypothetical protein [Blastocatellia bacterium]